MPGKTADWPPSCFKRLEEAASDITRGSRQQDERPMVRFHWETSICLAMPEPARF